MTEQLFLTPTEAGALMGGYHRSTIYRMIKTGELRAKKVRGKIRIHRDTIDAWARAQQDAEDYRPDPKRLETRSYTRRS